MVTTIENGHDDQSSILGRPDCLSHITNNIGKCMNLNYSSSSYGQIGPTGLFNLGMATAQGEGKF